MTTRRNIIIAVAALALAGGAILGFHHIPASASEAVVTEVKAEPAKEPVKAKEEKPIKKVLFIGDSMTGWMAERLNAYGQKNGFEVATIVWDGSTLKKWGSTANLKSKIDAQQPDAIFVSLGLNELFEANPEARLGGSLKTILNAFGDTPYLWIGPPTWPGHKEGANFNRWMTDKLGADHYFRSDHLQLERQSKSNPHPSRKGIIQWMDEVVQWIPANTALNFQSLDKPGAAEMSRGKVFIYKRMKESL